MGSTLTQKPPYANFPNMNDWVLTYHCVDTYSYKRDNRLTVSLIKAHTHWDNILFFDGNRIAFFPKSVPKFDVVLKRFDPIIRRMCLVLDNIVTDRECYKCGICPQQMPLNDIKKVVEHVEGHLLFVKSAKKT